MRRKRDNHGGFTLIEVLLVIVILVALATVAAVVLWPARDEANIGLTKTTIGKIMLQLDRYYTSLGSYPTEDQGLQALVVQPTFDNPDDAKNWHGPYLLLTDLKDAWGSPLVYKLDDDATTGRKIPRIHSLGPNKTDDNGDGDDIKDAAWEASDAATNAH